MLVKVSAPSDSAIMPLRYSGRLDSAGQSSCPIGQFRRSLASGHGASFHSPMRCAASLLASRAGLA